MKKKVLSILLAIFAIATTAQAQVVLNAENFPDDYLRDYVRNNYDLNLDNYLDENEIASVKEFPKTGVLWWYGDNTGCADFTGIEYFTEIETFWGYSYRATTLDLSKNTKLKSITFRGRNLSSINISRCKELEVLILNGDYNNMPLAELDVSNNLMLKELYCYNNQLTSLDVSNNTALKTLGCYNSQLTSLNVSKNTALTGLYCYNNQLTSLDVSNNTALTALDCGGNKLTSLDVSNNTALTALDCGGNKLTSLDVSQNTVLESLNCYGNQLTALDVSKNTALTTLSCNYNQLTSLDVSGCTSLTMLECANNQLTSLDVSKHTALTTLRCNSNQLTSLDVSKNTALEWLQCSNNQLKELDLSKNTSLELLTCASNNLSSLDFSQNKALDFVHCHDNQLKGKAMDNLVESLPTVQQGTIMVVDIFNENEANVCTKSQVATAKDKGWKVTRQIEGESKNYESLYYGIEYEGIEESEQEIDPVDEDDNIDYGSDLDENSNLDGNVIGNIYYNVGNGNGEYDAENGCVVIKKTTDDGAVNDLEGKDIFGDDFKGTFTGIVFKVPAGKGTVKVTAETTGNMLLKVKIGSDEPVEMELNGKLKISFPYNVSSESLVYIYAGTSAEAKGLNATSSTDAALKIYGIEFLRDDATSIEKNNRETITNNDWYSIDGKKLNGEPTKKGVYIVNGKKVVK